MLDLFWPLSINVEGVERTFCHSNVKTVNDEQSDVKEIRYVYIQFKITF